VTGEGLRKTPTDRPQLEIMPPDDDPLVFSPLVHTSSTLKLCLSQGTTGSVVFFNRRLELIPQSIFLVLFYVSLQRPRVYLHCCRLLFLEACPRWSC
jgi:hypothetical protein